MTNLIKDHPEGSHPFAVSLLSVDEDTASGVAHRALTENGHNDVLLEYMIKALQEHHISPDALKRHRDLIDSLKIANAPTIRSPYPQNPTTRKGNFAEILLAEYLRVTTATHLPVYRLRYNTNPDQSMKGDDVLLFDVDSNPVRIVVGETKFRSIPDKQSVIDIVDGLGRSNKVGLPVSLMFIANRLFEEGNNDIGKKVMDCALLFATNKLRIDYVGFLMSNYNAKNPVNKHTSNNIHNLLMISLAMQEPNEIVQQAFDRLEASV